MLYTRKGDDGKTSAYHCDQRFSKSSAIAEALGSLDELNSFLGVIKAKSQPSIANSLHKMQENLFIIQAEVACLDARRAGAEKTIGEEKIREAEDLIAGIEKEIPPITSFIVSGVSIESAELDFARTLVRRAERRVVGVLDEGLVKVSAHTLAYLNRLSSLLFALARLSAHKSGINESAPSYE
jgi:cob(I)alamin adenosyltransferase